MTRSGRQHMSGARPSKAGAGAAMAGGVKGLSFGSSPLLASPTPPWRSRFVVALVALGFMVLFGRAVWLQILNTDFYQAQGEKRFVHTQPLPASRGRILDRHGQLLATSVAMPTVQVESRSFAADTAQRRALAQALGMAPRELDTRLAGATGTVTLKRHVDEAVWEQVAGLRLKGVQQVREYQRRWPEGEAAAHVVGFTDIDGRGIDGVELAFQSQLVGTHGRRTVVRDRFGRVVEDIGEPAGPAHGADVVLALDSKVQFVAWQQLRDAVRAQGAQRGSAVVVDALSGEVLAMANYPGFDPAARSAATVRSGRLRNAALTDVFEPGSTMKPFTAALALERGPWKPGTRIDTSPGHIVVTGSRINDAHPHGVLTLAEVIQKSSNVGTVKLAQQMPARAMWEMFTGIGLGQRPQIDFPGAVTGRLRPYKSWRPVEQATMSYGYGLSASLLQLAQAYTVFARDGELIPLTMLKAADGAPPVTGRRVFEPAHASAVREMLRLAAGPGGTAPRAQALGYSVAGKTGTARKLEGKVYSTSKYRSFFVGVAPATQPRIVVAVMIDEPSRGVYYAGEVAAPVFSQVVQHTLRLMNVAPDLDVKAQISAPAAVGTPESF